jgi:NAD(P)-dependent dehydrogenase (short-subunit alcohol dehydrogenase family)
VRLVLDASVAIAAQRPQEAAYAASRARLVRFLTGADVVVVPSFFVVECAFRPS